MLCSCCLTPYLGLSWFPIFVLSFQMIQRRPHGPDVEVSVGAGCPGPGWQPRAVLRRPRHPAQLVRPPGALAAAGGRGVEGVDVDRVVDGPVGPHGSPGGQQLQAGQRALAGKNQVTRVHTAEMFAKILSEFTFSVPRVEKTCVVEAALTKWRMRN